MFTPLAAAKDSVVTITGKNFSTTLAGNIVTINDKPAVVLSATGDQLTVKVPAHAGIGVLTVEVGGQQASAPDIFQYLYTVTTIAGDGEVGFKDGAANVAEFDNPIGIGVDGGGNLYVADVLNNRVRKITPDGQVSTLAGDGTPAFKEGNGTAAELWSPSGVAVTQNGVVYVADAGNSRIRKITATGDVSTFAGDGYQELRDGAANQARFKIPVGITLDATGDLYVADTYNSSIRKITAAGTVSTVAGNGTLGYQDGAGGDARFRYPGCVVVDASGFVFVGDADNRRIRRIDPAGQVVTLAGDGTTGFQDGPGPTAKFSDPIGVADGGHGYLFVSDFLNHCIRQISPTGIVFTVAGDSVAGYKDGVGKNARFQYPAGITIDGAGNLFVVDLGNSRIRKLE